MANGILKLYNKLTNISLVDLNIVGTFNIEDNLNDTPSNMKVKVITSNTYRKEFEINTVAYHQDTNSWWVIKADTSTYLQTGEYEHEIELVEYLEFYSYKHLPNCAFAPNTYTLKQMLERLFRIAKVSINVDYPNFLDQNKLMPFLSFENYTLSNAIKSISRVIDAIPKMYVSTSPSYQPKLYFINRVGLDNPVKNNLNDEFTIQYELNRNSSDQFTTRSISNMQNVKSSNLVIAPQLGGFKNFVPNDIVFDNDNRESARVLLPSKIDKIEYVNVFIPIELKFSENGTSSSILFTGYYTNREEIENLIDSTSLSSASKLQAKNNLPDPETFYRINYNSPIDINYSPIEGALTPDDNMFFKKMNLLSKFEFDTLDNADIKDRTIHWRPFTNEVIMPLSFRNGLSSNLDHNEEIVLAPRTSGEPFFWIESFKELFFFSVVPNEKILIQVAYYPIADIKVSIDNDNDAQDEKYFNQNGKLIDALSSSKLVFTHTQDSAEGTKIRNAKYDDISNVLPLGQLVRDSGDLYVVSQRSLDILLANGNEWVNAIYTLSKNRIARSENILAESSVISYKIPDDNLVFRNQLYKDYIELSLTNGNHDVPYLSMDKALVFGNQLCGTNFNFTVLARSGYGELVTLPDLTVEPTTMLVYIKNPSTFDLHKSKLSIANWEDNNILGFRFQRVSNTLTQTPISYTDNIGRATNFNLVFVNKEDIDLANQDYNSPTVLDVFAPFTDLTQVPASFYSDNIIDETRYDVRIVETAYDKDAFEIPVFEYMLQGNDDYSALGNVVIGNELFSSYNKTSILYNYVVSDTRFTAENANQLFASSSPAISSSIQRVVITRPVGTTTTINLKLYSQIIVGPPPTLNTLPLQGKHIGIFAVGSDSTRKFLFAINDYAMSSNNDINLYINNWKI